MHKCWFEILGVAMLLSGALAFANLLADLPLIALGSVLYVALSVAGYEICRHKSNKR